MTDALRERLQAALGSSHRLGRELGGGGMSRVFVVRDEELGRDVVVKVFSPDLAQELSVERFQREIRLAAALQHANIVPVLSAGATADGLPFYLMPFVEGESLRHRLEDGRGLPVGDVLVVLRDVSRALAYAHERGVVHRDIKPDNVMLSGGAAVVTDFGIAKALSSARTGAHATGDDALTRMGTSIGTPAYMAPEQGAGDPSTDHRADLYALGAAAYELLTGAPPFGRRAPHALLVAHLGEPPVPVAERRPDVPASLAELVMRLLAKDPDQRPQTAGEVLEALDAMGGSGVTATGGAAGTARTARPASRRRTLVAVALAAVVVAGAVAGVLGWRAVQRPAGMDATLLAVLPFTVRDPALGVWREGMVDVLSRSLDGAGALRTVAPSTVIARSGERSDAAEAARVGEGVGAGLVLFGDLSRAGGDSVHLRAALFDVAAGRVRQHVDLRGDGARMDALADSLAFRVLRELGAAGELGGSPLYSIGTRSLPALRAFLRGQQHYRRGRIDSVRAAYLEAVEQDSTFALAWRGVALLYIRNGQENSPEAQQALERAIRYKSGRSPRDSMALRADSLRLAIVRTTLNTVTPLEPVPLLPALLETLREATTLYPSDAELWYEYGDAIFHFGEFAGVPPEQALAAFERGIALDSSTVVPYFHALDVSLRLGRAGRAAHHARRVAELMASSPVDHLHLLAAVLDSGPRFTGAVHRALDTLPARNVAFVIDQLAALPDTAAIALQLARLQREDPSPRPEAGDSTALNDAITLALLLRGRIREAREARQGPMPPAVLLSLAQLGAAGDDSAAERARRWLRGDPSRAYNALPLWAEEGDTASIQRLVRWADSVATTPTRGEGIAGRPPRIAPPLARAYLALARRDSAAALAALLALPIMECGGAPCAGATLARLLAADGRDAEAARVLDRWLPSMHRGIGLPRELLLRAQLAERMGDDNRALELYRRVVTLWRDGDPETRPIVAEASAALHRLGG